MARPPKPAKLTARERLAQQRQRRRKHQRTMPNRLGRHRRQPAARPEPTMRKYLIAGLLVWIPLVITGWVLKLLVDTRDQTLLLLPERFQTEALLGFHVPGMGVILTLLIVLGTGVLAANF